MSSSIRLRLGILLVLFSGGLARAAQVLSVDKTAHTIVISQRTSGSAWMKDEPLCVLHDWKEVACGTVSETGSDTAKVRLKNGVEAIAVGDFVQAAPTVKGGTTVAVPETPLPKNVRLLHIYQSRLGAVLEAGPDYVLPGLQYQFTLDRNTCLGVTGGYWSLSPSQATLKGVGAILNISFYQTRCYQGAFLSFDLGGYFLHASSGGVEETVNSATGGASVGYDIRLGDRLTMRVGGGGRYLTHPHGTSVSYDLDPWIYFFSGSLGWRF